MASMNMEERSEKQLKSLSREDLVKLVQKLWLEKDEAQKQMETAKKEAEESAKQAEEFSQRNIQLERQKAEDQEELRELMAENVEMFNEMLTIRQNAARQAEESASRQAEIVQVEQEKAEVHADLDQNMAKIVEMHKEVEEKSEELAEKANEINTLLMQLIKSIREQQQHRMPPQQPMKIQLSLEIWYDWLGFVPRHRLGEVVPQIGDLRFASIVQKFLHEYREITLDEIRIVAPCVTDPSGPRVSVWQKVTKTHLRFQMAETQMPANITNFNDLDLSYFDRSVLSFMRKFQQNGLLDNVTLSFSDSLKDEIQPVMCHLLPLINNIDTLYLEDSTQLVDIYDAGNSKEIHEMNMKMMEKTRLLAFRDYSDPDILHANTMDLYCRWLYQSARANEKMRALFFEKSDQELFGIWYQDFSPVYVFIDRLKQDFLMATDPATFFIRIDLPEDFQLHEDINLDNDKTNERMLTKTELVPSREQVVLLISRYPRASTKKWIVENEEEVSNWDISDAVRMITLTEELEVVAI